MRRPSPFIDRSSNLEIKMTPMIDVVFLLLVFFIWTSSFQIVERVLPSNVTAISGTDSTPQDQPPPPEEDFDKVVIRLRQRAGRLTWRINDVEVAGMRQMRERLDAIAKIKQDVPVILHPDPDVALGDVINVYDITRLAGFQQIQFAASEKI